MRDRPSLLLHGNFRDSTSFAIVNHHLSAGLKRLGYGVTEMPFGGPAPLVKDVPPPDIYLFHGFPHDIHSAPGRLNVFLFVCEYHRLEARFSELVGAGQPLFRSAGGSDPFCRAHRQAVGNTAADPHLPPRRRPAGVSSGGAAGAAIHRHGLPFPEFGRGYRP